MTTEQHQEILRTEGLSKFFPGVKALDNVDFSLRRGEIMALLGENGAGKSTLIKSLTGVYHADRGTIWLEDNADVNAQFAAITALGRVGVPDDIGPMVASLLRDDNRWVTAQRIEVSGGQTI